MKAGDSVAVTGGSASRPAAMKSPPPGKTETFLGVVQCGSLGILCFDLHETLLFSVDLKPVLLQDQVGQIETKLKWSNIKYR